ncbi:MAG: peptide chain release factor N(5)-glutamine methyltransferase [Vicinamibacteria bacterium]
MSAARLIANAATRLSALPHPQLDAEMLFRGVSGRTRADLLAHPDAPVSPKIEVDFEAALARRVDHEPLQYILGTAAFWRDDFIVTPAVLIPRPDSETLVEVVAARLRSLPSPTLLDLGTGSGCIALSLLRELPAARAVAVDLSEAALEVARLNAHRLGLQSRVDLRVSRWLDAIDPTERFNAVVSNPPYIGREEAAGLAEEVRDHEPALALFADPGDDLSSYRAILQTVHRHLRAPGILAFEVAAGQADRVAALLSDAGFVSIEAIRDLASIPRVVLGQR